MAISHWPSCIHPIIDKLISAWTPAGVVLGWAKSRGSITTSSRNTTEPLIDYEVVFNEQHRRFFPLRPPLSALARSTR